MNQIHIELAGLVQRFLDHILSDGVEGDALVMLELQALLEMPGDGLAFAVRIGCQIDGFGAHRPSLEVVDDILAAFGVLVLKLVIRRGYAQGLLRQVADVADTGGNLPSWPEKGFDLLYLVRTFDNHQIHVRFFFM